MSALQTVIPALVPATREALDKLDAIDAVMLQAPQIPIATEHVIHGGMYARTIRLVPESGEPKDQIVLMGSLIKRATVLIVNGPASVVVGDERVELEGYNVIPGCAGRKQLFVTRGGPVEMTMIIPTSAMSVEQAEDEVFAQADRLMSRTDGSRDTITITGE